jgi:hypothetical protein
MTQKSGSGMSLITGPRLEDDNLQVNISVHFTHWRFFFWRRHVAVSSQMTIFFAALPQPHLASFFPSPPPYCISYPRPKLMKKQIGWFVPSHAASSHTWPRQWNLHQPQWCSLAMDQWYQRYIYWKVIPRGRRLCCWMILVTHKYMFNQRNQTCPLLSNLSKIYL